MDLIERIEPMSTPKHMKHPINEIPPDIDIVVKESTHGFKDRETGT